MGLIKEPKNVDFTVQSGPWTEEELKDLRSLMNELKAKHTKKKVLPSAKKRKSVYNSSDFTLSEQR